MLFNNAGGFGAPRRHRRLAAAATRWRRWAAMKIAVDRAARAAVPVHVERWEIEPDSMGVGRVARRPGHPPRGPAARRRHGRACHLRRRLHEPAARRARRHAGHRRRPVRRGARGRRRAASSRARRTHARRPRRRSWVGVSTGGGGYGDPSSAPPERVRARRARRHRLARARAREVYGVVLSDDRDPVLDDEATARLRDGARAGRAPAASTRPRRTPRPGSTKTCARATCTCSTR